MDRAIAAEVDFLDLFDMQQAGNQQVDVLCHPGRIGGRGRALRHELLHGLMASIMNSERVACTQQILRHGIAHSAKPDKTDLHFWISSKFNASGVAFKMPEPHKTVEPNHGSIYRNRYRILTLPDANCTMR